jgi:hypothetical protein
MIETVIRERRSNGSEKTMSQFRGSPNTQVSEFPKQGPILIHQRADKNCVPIKKCIVRQPMFVLLAFLAVRS